MGNPTLSSLRTALMGAAVAASGLAGTSAGAAALDFDYRSTPSFFFLDAAWTQARTPTPLADVSGAYTDVPVENGVYTFGAAGAPPSVSGVFADVDFYNLASSGPLGPGGFEAGPVGDFGPQLYRSSEAAPVFGPGVYALANGVLTVTAVPEQATWALMMLGVGAIGAALRARRLTPLSPRG